MTLIRKQNTISRVASADLSSNQHRIMTITATGGSVVAAVDAATAPIGILMNKPGAAGRECEIAIVGSVVKLEAGATVDELERICAVAGGRGSPTATAGDHIVGIALTPAAASAELFEVLVSPSVAGTTAL